MLNTILKKIDINQLCIQVGVLLLLLGGIFRAVDSFVLSPSTTRVLASWTGPPKDTPQGALKNLIVKTTSPQKVLSPPDWLGYALICSGVVLSIHGILQKRNK